MCTCELCGVLTIRARVCVWDEAVEKQFDRSRITAIEKKERKKSMNKEIKFKKLNEAAQEPTYGTEMAAGADVRASADVTINPGETVLVPTGLSVELPEGTVGLLFPRSGISMKTPLRMANSVGVIDADYRGEIKAGFTNIQSKGEYPLASVTIEKGDRIAQLVVVPYIHAKWVEATELSGTDRGAGGFGSTGVK